MKDNQQVNSLSMGRRDFAQVNGATGKVYQKQIIKFGDYVDPWFPDWPMTLDSEWGDRIVENFNKGVVGRVPVPASHTDDPEKNRGELINLENDGEGLNGQLDIRDPEMVDRIENGLVWDDSISFTNNYVDEKGIGWGPVLFHVALVNNPYITGMKGFEALSRVVSDLRFAFSKTHKGSAIVLSKQVKELSNMLVKIENDKDYAVTVKYQDADGKDQEVTIDAGGSIEVPEATAEGVKQQVADAEKPADEGGEGEGSEGAGAGEGAGEGEGGEGEGSGEGEGGEGSPAVNNEGAGEGTQSTEGGASNGQLSKKDREELEALRAEKAETMFSKLVDEGKVVPAQKEAILGLAKQSGADAVAKMFEKAKPVIDFSERGSQNEHKDNTSGEPSNSGVKQWSDLSQSEQANLKTLGVTEESYNETALANPEHYRKQA